MNRVLKFEASWCQPCKMLTKTLEGIDADSLATIVKVDIDEEGDLAQQFGVRGVPTMVMVDADNKEIKRLVGMHPEAKLKEWFV
jgi:thioredoxin 1